MDLTSTIIAVSTPPGVSRRGMVRVSGAGTVELVDTLVDTLVDRPARDGHPRGFQAAVLDLGGRSLPVLLLAFTAPRSYTGEDVVEIQLPGSPVLLDRVVRRLVAAAAPLGIEARLAEAGEFTARAFMNGRLSLVEAEGIEATITARSDAELRAARLLVSGRLGAETRGHVDELAGALALVEAGIDFTDEDDVVAITPPALGARLARVTAALGALLEHAVGTERLEAIPWVVITGRPNAGKSTLFNALLGHERAVVSDLAGTTRDVLAEPLTIETGHGPAEVMLADVAGREHARTTIDARMQDAAADARQRAELILECVPVDQPAPAARPDRRRELLVRTKGDLGCPGDEFKTSITVSALSGAALETLRGVIAERLADRAVSLAADAVALRPRHEAALRAAHEHLVEARVLVEHVIERGGRALDHSELVAASMRAALDALGALVGDVTPDDVLGRIFASFCVGK